MGQACGPMLVDPSSWCQVSNQVSSPTSLAKVRGPKRLSEFPSPTDIAGPSLARSRGPKAGGHPSQMLGLLEHPKLVAPRARGQELVDKKHQGPELAPEPRSTKLWAPAHGHDLGDSSLLSMLGGPNL